MKTQTPLSLQWVPSFGDARRWSLGSQHKSMASSHITYAALLPSVVRDGMLPAVPCSLMQCEPEEVLWTGNGIHGPDSQRLRQENLWRQYFQDPTLWWDNRHSKKSSRSPDFRHRESNEVLWLNNSWKPAWVDEQLAALDKQRGHPPSTSASTLQIDSSLHDVTAEGVSRLCQNGKLSEAVNALCVLVQTESPVSTSLLYSVLKRCVTQKNLALGRRVHEIIVRAGHESHTFLANHIVRMYGANGRLLEANEVFSRLTNPDAFSWSAIISSHVKHGEARKAIDLYAKMRSSSVKPTGHVLVAALQACASARDLESGRRMHHDVLESGVQDNMFVWTCLLDMYAKCGKLEVARKIFDSLATRDVVTWNVMISGYAQHERCSEALCLYERMQAEGVVEANSFTFSCLLKSCASVGSLQQGQRLHSEILERGLGSDVVLGTCLVDMYAKCGRLKDARRVFDSLAIRDVVAWNAMITGYAEQGLDQDALSLYATMEQEGMTVADAVTFACLLKSCASSAALQQGKLLHKHIMNRKLETDTLVGNSLVDMYAKCSMLADARKVFNSLPSKDVVSWTAMIAGYADHGLGQQALCLYGSMELEGLVAANPFTYACLLKGCASVAALQQGRRLHSQILERGLETHTLVSTCLIDMYAKCGMLEEARKVFDSLPSKDVVTWNAMLNGFGQNDEGHKAIEFFQEMMFNHIEANGATFTSLLVACSHEGLVKEGQQFFKNMVEECGIVPSLEHHNCMVDLLGRAGHLDEAERLLLPFQSSYVGFMSLLSACRRYRDLERANRCFESLVSIDPQNAAAYVVMENAFADVGRWSDVERIEKLRISAGASKKPAVAGLEVDNHVHTFVVGENRGDISSKVRSLQSRLTEQGGHVPRTELVLKQLPEADKEDVLCGHAEKLALAYGLLNTPEGTPLLVTKNLRMCGDCHDSTELMSRIEQREIIVRDSHRVHRFKDGFCRCGGRP